jgi:transcriptional regulator with XRE-family HTH domain
MKLMSDPTAPRKRRKGAARSVAGKAIDRLRHKAGLTLVQAASGAGLTKHQLREIMSGKRPATCDEAALLARFFHAKPETFIVSTPAPIPAAKAPPATLNGVTPPKTNPKRPGYNPEVALRQLTEMTEPRDSDTFFQASLRRIMRTRGLMGLHVAKLCGLTLDVPSRLLRDGNMPRPATREKLLAGLGVTEEELFGPEAAKPEPKAPEAAPKARLAAPAPELVPEADPDHGAALVAPTVPVEMDIPMPVIVLRSDRYPWDMPKGGSFKAEVPFGMPWETFRSRFLKMIDRQSEALGHWYTFEENEAQGLIRVWRYI